MFDYVEIDDELLPDEIKGNGERWQSKSYGCYMDLLKITSGKLFFKDSWSEKREFKELDYTGEIRVHHTIDEQTWTFSAFFESGWLDKFIQIEPKPKIKNDE